MIFHGFQKTTLLDFPGHIASMVFTAGCNFRCPYCHNASLVLPEQNAQTYTQKEVLSFLTARKNLTEGLCISGGEPTLHAQLPAFIEKVKALGLLVKLDTNGTNPSMLATLLEKNLLDYVALDIKAPFSCYPQVTGFSSIETEKVKQSLALLFSSTCPYECRTTIVKELHTQDMIREITKEIAGCTQYYLQNFKDSGDILIYRRMPQTPPLLSSFGAEEALALLSAARERIPTTELR